MKLLFFQQCFINKTKIAQGLVCQIVSFRRNALLKEIAFYVVVSHVQTQFSSNYCYLYFPKIPHSPFTKRVTTQTLIADWLPSWRAGGIWPILASDGAWRWSWLVGELLTCYAGLVTSSDRPSTNRQGFRPMSHWFDPPPPPISAKAPVS